MIPPSKEEIEAVQASSLFDAKWYLETYSEVKVLGMDPAEHYLWYGARLNCDPSPEFKTYNYLKDNPDVEANGLNPLLHFLATSVCDTKPEASVIPRTKQHARLLIHRNPASNEIVSELDSAATDGICNAAIAANAESANTAQHEIWREALLHYVDPTFYLRRYVDVRLEAMDPIDHFIECGFSEGRDPNAFTHTRFMKNVYGAEEWTLDIFIELLSVQSYLNAFLKKPVGLHILRDCLTSSGLHFSDLFMFDVPSYAKRQLDLLAHGGIHPLEHLFEYGLHENRLRASGLLDTNVVYGAKAHSDYEIAQLQVEPFPYIGFDSLTFPDPPRQSVDHVRVGIGVVLYKNSRAEVERLMRSIVRNSRSFGGEIEVAFWDNSPASLDLEYVAEVIGDLTFTIHRCPANDGFSGGHNALMTRFFRESCTHYIGLNPDGWLLENAQSEALWFSTSLGDKALIELKTEPLCHPKWYHPETGETDWVSGAAFVMPRAIFDSVGGFDPDFPMYCEDVDLSFRARLAGFDLRVSISALFYHDVTDRLGKDTVTRKRLMLIGTWYLCVKWGHDTRAMTVLKELLKLGVERAALPAIKARSTPNDGIRRLLEHERFSHSRYWN